MNKNKLVYIVSDVDRAIAFEWLALCLAKKFDLCFVVIGRHDTEFSNFLRRHSIRYYEIVDKKNRDWISKFIRLLSILLKEKPSAVHTHLWRANLLGLSSAWIVGIKKRVYTRHHALVHYNEYPAGLKWDRLCNRMATHIIAISNNVRNILIEKDKANPKKVFLIPHGFKLSYFQNIKADEIRNLKEKYKINFNFYPVVGIISRFEKWKGVQYVIPAFKELKAKYPQAHLILINAQGSYSGTIKNMLRDLNTSSFTEIVFESNLAAIYHFFDIFVHVPTDAESEAFGQTYVEALASGIPSVFTLSGIAPEFIVHEYNALVVPFCSAESIYNSVVRILESVDLKNRLITNGKESAGLFPLSKMITQLEGLYES